MCSTTSRQNRGACEGRRPITADARARLCTRETSRRNIGTHEGRQPVNADARARLCTLLERLHVRRLRRPRRRAADSKGGWNKKKRGSRHSRRLIPDEEMALHVHLGQGSLQLRISRGSGEADHFIEFCDTLKAP